MNLQASLRIFAIVATMNMNIVAATTTPTTNIGASSSSSGQQQQISMGTTIFAVRFRDGVVVGADSRTSVSGYVSNRYATKISFVLEDDFGMDVAPPLNGIQLKSSLLDMDIDKRESLKINTRTQNGNGNGNGNEKQQNGDLDEKTIDAGGYKSTCCICRSGSAADTQYLADTVRHQILRRKVTQRSSSSISNVAHLIKNYLLDNELQASLICAGYDHIKDEGVIYSIDLGGTLMEQPLYACNGSGSSYILGYIDEQFNAEISCTTLTETEAVEFVGNAIQLAMDRDGSSGGVVRIYVINREGKKEILLTPDKRSDKLRLSTNNKVGDESNLSGFAPSVR